MNVVALVPARAGSKRVPGKNIRPLAGRPLIEWTIRAAQESGVFSDVVVSSESWKMAIEGVRFLLRSADFARDDSPDIEWVRDALAWVECDAFAILRPTSPFRTADTIRRAMQRFMDVGLDCDSLRAVELVRQSPYKMWRISERGPNPTLWMKPLLQQGEGTPYHSRPTQTHPPVYAQNASLEIAWRRTVERTGTIAGERIIPFFTTYPEGFDINTEEDWTVAERIAADYLRADRDRVAGSPDQVPALGY